MGMGGLGRGTFTCAFPMCLTTLSRPHEHLSSWVYNPSLGAGVPSTPLRLLPSPLRPANQHMLQTPSPVRLGASSFFATPGGPFPGTPVTEAMAAAGWLQDLSARSPSEVRAAGESPCASVHIAPPP